MRHVFKTVTVTGMMTAFVAAMVLCCCVTRVSQAFSINKVKPCSHCPVSKAVPVSKDCPHMCLWKSQAETAKFFTLAPVVILAVLSAPALVYPAPRFFSGNVIYVHGPPIRAAVVPLYLQSHSLRI
ncbi:MAG: hypothetical protein HY591_01380 [Candidatus Omnitrophica bacterium]|nr:hypothetical protein [Candidatus Omnitrophota bacterium]